MLSSVPLLQLRPCSDPHSGSSPNTLLSAGSYGETGIRTLDGVTHAGFQNQCIRPLCHLSKGPPTALEIELHEGLTRDGPFTRNRLGDGSEAGEEGFEPPTSWLTAKRSASELLANKVAPVGLEPTTLRLRAACSA